MDENSAPYLFESGVKLYIEQIQSSGEFNTGLDEQKIFNKGKYDAGIKESF